jgi:FAD/FMN-containing dehydrogenase
MRIGLGIHEEARRAFPDAALDPRLWAPYESDTTVDRGLRGKADAVLLPRSAAEMAAVLGWCYRRDIPMVPRGGGTGFSGGAVPLEGGMVVGTERLVGTVDVDPASWTVCVGAGYRTSDVRRLCRENGLWYPVDPGAGEESCIGGNVATNAGGPHAFKYGVTGRQVLSLEVALAPGVLTTFGSGAPKDVAAYDLVDLLVGSEGTLGIVTEVTLRARPAREAAFALAAVYPSLRAGCEAIEAARTCGAVPAVLEFVDGTTLSLTGLPAGLEVGGEDASFLVLAEADGPLAGAEADRGLLLEALAPEALATFAPTAEDETAGLWRWRDGLALGVNTLHGGKLSEDVAVPPSRLGEAIEETLAIGARHGVDACSWGHAGDGNLHSTFLIDPTSPSQLAAAEEAAAELFAFASALGGTPSGEHGIGAVKRTAAGRHLSAQVMTLQESIRRSFDPKGLLNPGKKW